MRSAFFLVSMTFFLVSIVFDCNGLNSLLRPFENFQKQRIEEMRKVLKEGIDRAEGFVETFERSLKNIVVKPNLDDISKWFDEFMTIERAVNLGIVTALFIAIPSVSRIAINMLEKRLLRSRPKIIDTQAHPKYGRFDRLKRWWSGYKTPAIIFDQSVKDHLIEIQKKTKNIRDHIRSGDTKATYSNLLLYGPPGTGKTLFARVLADYADMDFLPTTAEALMRSSTGFDDLVEMANRSTYGAIIFIDEIDALFLSREKLLQSNDSKALAQQRLVSHIMAMIGQRSNKFMLIGATNYAYLIDPAINRRFHEKVEMPLPDTVTRRVLFDMYVNDIFFDENDNSKEFVLKAQELLSAEKIEEMVELSDGFSPAAIYNMLQSMRDSARATDDGILVEDHVVNAIKRAKHDYLMELESGKKREQVFGKVPA